MKNNNNPPKRRDLSILNETIYATVQLHAEEPETAVLGAMMQEPDRILDVQQILRPDDFFREAHQIICEIIFRMYDKTIIPDIIIVVEELRRMDKLDLVGGPHYVMKLTNDLSSSASTVGHCRIIKQYSIARKLEAGCFDVLKMLRQREDVFQVLSQSKDIFTEIDHDIESTTEVSLVKEAAELVKNTVDRVEMARRGEKNTTDIFTGFKNWDAINGPLSPGLYTVAGRPGMGKSAFVTQLVVNMAKDIPFGLINGEMHNKEVIQRMASNLKKFDNGILKKPAEMISDNELIQFTEAVQDVMGYQFYMDTNTEIHRICSKIRYWVDRYKIKAAGVDFLQFLRMESKSAKYMSEEQLLREIMRLLADLSKETGIPIFLLSQISRENLKRGGSKEPTLGDLRGSDYIEQLSYQVSFLHRPEYYDADAVADEFGESTRGLCYHIIAKFRGGSPGRLKHRFLGQYSAFEPWEPDFILPTPSPNQPLTDEPPF